MCETNQTKDRAFASPVEWGKVARTAAVIKNMFGPWCPFAGGGHRVARLVRPLMKVLQSGTRHAPGQRCVADGNLRLLEGFEFNETHRPLALSQVRCSLLRSDKSDQVLVKTDAFMADVFLTPRVFRATHFKVALLVAAFPLQPWGRKNLYQQGTGSMVVGQRAIPSLQALVNLVISETSMLYCAALAVSFFRFAGSQSRPYDNGRQDLLRLVKVFSA